jgi:hypothetical protein
VAQYEAVDDSVRGLRQADGDGVLALAVGDLLLGLAFPLTDQSRADHTDLHSTAQFSFEWVEPTA